MARITHLLIAGIAALMLGACASQPSAPGDATDISKNPHFAATKGQILSRLKLQTIGERRDGDLLRFQAVVLNTWHSEVTFKYQVLWYDAGNMLIGAESRPWHAITLAPNSVHSIEATAPRASADHYVIQLQDQ